MIAFFVLQARNSLARQKIRLRSFVNGTRNRGRPPKPVFSPKIAREGGLCPPEPQPQNDNGHWFSANCQPADCPHLYRMGWFDEARRPRPSEPGVRQVSNTASGLSRPDPTQRQRAFKPLGAARSRVEGLRKDAAVATSARSICIFIGEGNTPQTRFPGRAMHSPSFAT